MSFKDKVVWITGASSGIGEHLAYAFAEQGARLALSARKEQELARVRQNCPKGTDILLLPLDITRYDDAAGWAEQVATHFGYINILVNNAGMSQRALVKDAPFSMDQKLMAVNYLGAVALTKAVLPYMIKQQFGHIVVVSSVMGKVGTPLRSAYAASKHALHGFFDCLRAEVYDENIRVTILVPGFIRTNLLLNALRPDKPEYHNLPDSLQKGIDPGDFAQKVLRAISAGKQEVFIGGTREALAIYLNRFLPRLFSRIIRKARVT
ncbi:MAG: SDR family oxidoreductase [Phaeodactylibacter sp.]|nr:SDR family oxidoreductase [Phaeodactylibacter sp.]MCB9274701.1 SDR family oxidoreductase [Lewinellaceae bacterium]